MAHGGRLRACGVLPVHHHRVVGDGIAGPAKCGVFVLNEVIVGIEQPTSTVQCNGECVSMSVTVVLSHALKNGDRAGCRSSMPATLRTEAWLHRRWARLGTGQGEALSAEAAQPVEQCGTVIGNETTESWRIAVARKAVSFGQFLVHVEARARRVDQKQVTRRVRRSVAVGRHSNLSLTEAGPLDGISSIDVVLEKTFSGCHRSLISV